MDKRGETEAHLVAVVKPYIGELGEMENQLGYNYTEWSSACSVQSRTAGKLTWSATMFSTFKVGVIAKKSDRPPHHCLRCYDLIDQTHVALEAGV